VTYSPGDESISVRKAWDRRPFMAGYSQPEPVVHMPGGDEKTVYVGGEILPVSVRRQQWSGIRCLTTEGDSPKLRHQRYYLHNEHPPSSVPQEDGGFLIFSLSLSQDQLNLWMGLGILTKQETRPLRRPSHNRARHLHSD
jgi:hypothetical protein